MKKRILLSTVCIIALLMSSTLLSSGAVISDGGNSCEGIPATPIPNGLLYPFVPEWQKFIRYEPVEVKPIPHAEIAQHPFMAPNVGNNMHADTYMSETYKASGPLGIDLQVSSTFLGLEMLPTITYDKAGRLVAVGGSFSGFRLVLMDPDTLAELASYDLPKRPWYWILSGVPPWQNLGGGTYYYLDNEYRAVMPTYAHTIQVIQVPEPDTCDGFRLVREYDLSDYIMPMPWPKEDSIGWVLPDWSGGYYWFATAQGIVGTVDVDTGDVRTIMLEGELISNSFAVGEDGAYILSDYALYRFHQEDGIIYEDWCTEYERSSQIKPFMFNQGSGSTVTLMGEPEDGLVVIGDNAEPKMNILFIGRSDGAVVCSEPVFEEGLSCTENSLIGFEHGDECGNGIGEYSVVVENNWGDYFFPYYRVKPGGVTRIDCKRNDVDGTYSCKTIWESKEGGSGLPKLSFGNGLIYMYTRGEPCLITKWYFTTLDFENGETVYRVLTGTGLGYNAWGAPIHLHPDGGIVYSATLCGLVMIRDM